MTIDSNNRMINLFKFLKEYNDIKNPIITEISKQVWTKWMDNIDENKYITNNIYKGNSEDNIIFSVNKPERRECPVPPNAIKEWLEKGWNIAKNEISLLEKKEERYFEYDNNGKRIEKIKIIKFDDDANRVKLYNKWNEERKIWAKHEVEAEEAEDIFNELYVLYSMIKKDSESLELMIGDGLIYCNDKKRVDHPILLQEVKIEFDANIPRFTIIEGEKETELYRNLFGFIEDYNHELMIDIIKEFEENQYVPYEREISNKFLNRLVHVLSPKGKFVEDVRNLNGIEKYPKIYRKPVIFLRKRNLGFGVAIDSIIEDINTNVEIPDFLNDVVGIEGVNQRACIDEKKNNENNLLATNGVDEEVLLTKPANIEQLSVAKHLKRNSAVLVQGPPGTGKTHTISNVIGHLLSEGKSILVTSYSEKALSVLKEKVDPNLQALCLSLLSGVDSRKEMEVTLDEINAKRANLESSTLNNKIQSLESERKRIIKNLTELQLSLKNARTNEYRPIIIGGEEFKPIDAAKYIDENKDDLTKVPTPINLGEALSLSKGELEELYRSNLSITLEEEKEYESNLPDISELILPSDFKMLIKEKNKFNEEVLLYGKDLWGKNLDENNIEELILCINKTKEYLKYIKLDVEWVLECLEVGSQGDKRLWENLLSEIENTSKLYNKSSEFILKYNPQFVKLDESINIKVVFEEILSKLEAGGKIGKFNLLFNKSMKNLINSCRVNGNAPKTLEEFKGLYNFYLYNKERKNLEIRWDRQVAILGAENASTMGSNFEKTVQKYALEIKDNLEWYKGKWLPLINKVSSLGLDVNLISDKLDISSEKYVNLKYIKRSLGDKIVGLIEAEIERIKYNKINENKHKLEEVIRNKCENSTSNVLIKLKEAIFQEDIDGYEECYNCIIEIRDLGENIERRRELLEKLNRVAPKWAKLVQDREDNFGLGKPMDKAEQCWQYTQFIEELDDRNKASIEKIQRDILELEESLRSNTSELAFNKAWLTMLENLNNNRGQIQAIEGWRQLIRKIGAGTGKNAMKYKNEARKLMPKCQQAVPVWIMPLNKVVENFNPKENKFDVVIIDEASQADIMAIVALYLGKQVIIVGDNEQVSPLAIGEKIDEVDRLAKEYLMDIPNKSLYSGRFSIYDLAQSAGYQPVRLKEHFRCVPEIIQFSNMLSYNNQIKALRETSNIKTKPPIVTYRVKDAVCVNKVNEKEVEAITSLILACCKKDEYKGKTFGVITLRGEKQASEIEKMLQLKMDPIEFKERNILCGNSAQFQGDERDIIFITMVDANDKVGPMRLTTYGTDDLNKKRYNVAVSRAKDQLWVIHSMDVENDLKPGDIRKELLDYCKNYTSRQIEYEKNVVKAESEFEKRVMKYLIERGYNITPQWEVGAYRIDMVVSYEGKKIALECDGERWHGEDKLIEDMSRQAILERLGWRFIRIRGSEFFRDEEATMDNVIKLLNSMDIYQEEVKNSVINDEENIIIKEIISDAAMIRESW